MEITYRDIEKLTSNEDFGGFGYLGHSSRNHDTDKAIAKLLTEDEITLEDFFEWANSRYGRHFMDHTAHLGPDDFAELVDRTLGAEIGSFIDLQ